MMGFPVKISAVYNTAAYSHCMSIHVLGGTMGNDICTPLKRTAVDRGCEGIVHDQRYTMLMSYLCKFFNIQNGQRRICNGLSK